VTKHRVAPSHEPRWNEWTHLQAVQFDHEKASNVRPVRLSSPTARVGDQVRIGLSGGAEVEARITAISGPVLHVRVKATPLKKTLQPKGR
jgi:hypothetical protein